MSSAPEPPAASVSPSGSIHYLIPTQAKFNLRSRSGIGGVRSATYMTIHRSGRRWRLQPIVTAADEHGEFASLIHPQPGARPNELRDPGSVLFQAGGRAGTQAPWVVSIEFTVPVADYEALGTSRTRDSALGGVRRNPRRGRCTRRDASNPWPWKLGGGR